MPLWRFHNLGQHPAHILGMHEKNQCAMRANPRLAQNAFAQALELGLGGVDVGHFVTDMMLPTRRVLLKERRDGGIAR